MKLFFKLFLCFLFAIALWYFTEPYTRYKTRYLQNWANIYKSNNQYYDTFILGSSHAAQNFNPIILDDILGSKTLNMGISGGQISETYYQLLEIARTAQPKTIIIEIFDLISNHKEYKTDTDLGRALVAYDPMNVGLAKIQMVINTTSPNSWLNFLSSFFRENDFWMDLENLGEGIANANLQFDPEFTGYNNGFTIMSRSLSKQLDDTTLTNTNRYILDDLERKYLLKMKELSKQHHFDLYFVLAPIYHTQYYTQDFQSLMRETITFSIVNELKFIDLNSTQIIRDRRYFKDQSEAHFNQHLNAYGALYNTSNLADEILASNNQPKPDKLLVNNYSTNELIPKMKSLRDVLSLLQENHQLIVSGANIKTRDLNDLLDLTDNKSMKREIEKSYKFSFVYTASNSKTSDLHQHYNDSIIDFRKRILVDFTNDKIVHTYRKESVIHTPVQDGLIFFTIVDTERKEIIDAFQLDTSLPNYALIRVH